MATIPTPAECLAHLEGYGITALVITDLWVIDERDGTVIPFVEHLTGASISAEETFIEYLSGTGKDTILLSRRNVNSITAIELVSGNDIDGSLSLSSMQLISDQGIIKAKAGIDEFFYSKKFPKGTKNIKVTYTAGGTIDADIAMAIKKLVCVLMLDNIEGRTGGGALTVQGFGRQYGNMGKYSNIRKRLADQAMAILNRKKTSVVGS